MKLQTVWFPLPVAALVLWVGCGRPERPTPPAPVGHPLANPLVEKGDPAKPGGRLSLLTVGAPRTFNPLLAMDGASDEVVRLIFAGLVSLDPNTQEARPAMAESWSVAPDGRTWTFQLRAGLRWSDGEPLTAADVTFTWNEIMYNPDLNRVTYDLFRSHGKNFEVTAINATTVRVVTPEIFAPFLEFFGSVPILPQHAIADPVRQRRFLSVFTTTTRPDRIVGSGPFRVKEIKAGQSVLLERNPEFWAVDGQGTRLPYLDEVLITGVAGASPTLFFLNGHGDVCEQTRLEDFAALQTAATGGKFRVLDLGAASDRDFLWFNQNTNLTAAGQPLVAPLKMTWFRNRAFRQAISCAIDRDRLVREAYGGRALPALTFVAVENQKWNQPNVPHFGLDLARARTLLAGIGLQDRDGDGVLEDAAGHPVEFSLCSNTGNAAREKAAQFVVEDLRRLGCKVTYQPMAYNGLVLKVNESFDYECALMGLGGGGMDPASQMNVLKSAEPMHQWFPGQRSPSTEWEARLDTIMDAQMTAPDFGSRKHLFDEAQLILAEQLPMICTVAPFHAAAIRGELVNLRPSALAGYPLTWNIEQLARNR